MPINWGIESYKWKLCTNQIEPISYKTALKSVYTGICLGNIAPGRAMEFVAKIYFFKPQNRPTITILHFINGMFQMLITVVVGLISIGYKLTEHQSSNNVICALLIGGFCLIIFFCWAILNVSFIQKKLTFIKWFKKDISDNQVKFSAKLIFALVGLSIIRYFVFTFQFYLFYTVLSPGNDALATVTSIAAYFMLTSLIPMISFIEPAIRAAIALFVFDQSHNNATIILCATVLWLINVVLPSAIGYIIILREKIDFKSQHAN